MVLTLWGCSSAGRAPALQAGGQEFESPHLHHFVLMRNAKTSIRRKRQFIVGVVKDGV